MRYTRAGKSYAESSESTKKKDAKALLQRLEGQIVDGKPVTNKIGKIKFEDAAKALRADYITNKKKSYKVVERRIRLHLAPYFGGWRMANITTTHVREFIEKRQTDLSVVVRKARIVVLPDGSKVEKPGEFRPASNAEINRELAILKRMFSLALEAGTLLHRPHIPMLKEDNARQGFFEPQAYASVLSHLSDDLKPVIQFAHITGWRITSEVLPLEWRQVDFDAGEVRLDVGTTKNGEGRTFPMTAALRAVLTAQQTRLKQAGQITPFVFFRMVAQGRGGMKKPQQIIAFIKAWKNACRLAGCAGRIPHDLRRTAVRNLVRVNIPERVAMQLTGHKTRSVFERYNIVSPGDLLDAARRMDASGAR